MSEALFDLDRPTYSVPSMAEILGRDNGLTAVSTFSGCGGSSLGLHMAGWRIPYANEFTPLGAETYRANFPETYVDQRDIRLVQPEEILDRIGMRPGELDLLEGSPPCSSFSSAGIAAGRFEDKRGAVKDYSEGIKQATDDLFEEWVRLVAGIRPKAILAENVPDMAKPGAAADYLFGIQGELNALGYDVHAKVYSSLSAGAATSRKRLIIMGLRRDVGITPRPVLQGSGYTLREALEAMPVSSPEDELDWVRFDGTGRHWQTGDPLPVYQTFKHWRHCIGNDQGRPATHGRDICKAPDGEVVDLFGLGRASWAAPVATLTANGGTPGSANIKHPDEPRGFTATEAKWLSGFPIDFKLEGPPPIRYERIGRAVTPPLYRDIGEHLARAIKAGL